MTRELIIIELQTEDDFKTSWLEFFYFASIAPYFILGSVVDDGVGQDSAERGRGALLVAIWTGNVCEAFVMTCRQAADTKPTV